MEQKKKSLKVQLKEAQEKLRIEREVREEMKKEKEMLKKERNFWVKMLENIEEQRRAEAKVYEALIREEVNMMKCEMEKQRAMLKMEADENIKRLERAMDVEREQWRQEREKLLTDLENARRKHDHIEKQKLEIEAAWREHIESWAQKICTMLDVLDDKTKEIEELKRMVDELQKKAEMKESGMLEELQISFGKENNNLFRRLFQKKSIRKKEMMMKEIERLHLWQKESMTRQTRMADVMEDLTEEMDEMMRRSQAEKERIERESEKDRKRLMMEKKQESLKLKRTLRKSVEEVMEAKVKELTETFQAEKERLAMELEKQTKNVEEERKRCETIESSWREHSDKLEQAILEKDKLLKKRTKETEVLKRTIEVQQIKATRAWMQKEPEEEEQEKSVEEKELEVIESTEQREDMVLKMKPEEDTEIDMELEDTEIDMELEDIEIDMELEDIEIDMELEDIEIDMELEDTEIDMELEDIEIDMELEDTEIDMEPEEDTEIDMELEDIEIDMELEDTEIDMELEEDTEIDMALEEDIEIDMPGLTTTAIGAVDLQGAGGNWATVGRRSRGGRRVHRQREKRKGKSVGLRIGTLNVGTMTGKGRELADMMERRKVDILCVQETRWKGSKARSIGAGFKLFYYGVDSKRNGIGVVLKEEFVRNVLEVKRVSDRVMSLKLEIEGVMLNVVSGYAPQVGCELEEKERFWSELDEVMESIPTGERVVIGVDFNGHVGEGNTGDEEVMGKFGVKERNLEGQMVVDFAKRMDMAVVNTYFQKREEHRVTYKSGGRRTQVDYILCRRGNLKEISDCKVVVGESVARQHRMVVCRMTLMVCKKKRSKIEIEKKSKWWKLKKEECCEEFRQKLRQALGGQVVLPDDWETTAEVIRETGRKVLGVSSGRRKEDKETWWWNEEVQDSIQRKRLAKKKWDMDRTEENRQEYKELQCRVKREVSKAKQKAYDELYTRLDTREGEKDLYRLARQRDRDGKDVQQVRVIKDRDGRVLTSEESVQRRWKEYFEELMNEEIEREKKSRRGELCGTESR
ncbi:hypothetical protein QTP86_011718 [Hemibagrus guttatus]|nr:hypothetical protein QTP86_011718 [Hemibagrus guttatus]